MRISDGSSDVCSSDLSRGKLPKLKNELALLFLKRGQSPGQMVLTGPHSQIARTEEAARTIRAILTEANANPRRFKITEVGDAFHVPGTIPGESETQIFLRTSDQQLGRASCRERVCQYV